MKTGDSVTLKNGLSLCLDWLSFTIKEPCGVSDVITLLGYSENDFVLLPTGASGYRSVLKHGLYNISVLYDGREGMGVHVDISGSAISDVLMHFQASRMSFTPFGSVAYQTDDLNLSVLVDLFKWIKSNGHFTRMDIAIDDIGTNFYSVPELVNEVESKRCVSKFRICRPIPALDFNGNIQGYTVYFGQRTSDIMIRVYDKQLEQNSKLSDSEKIDYSWVRWEIELKRDRVNSFADMLINGVPLQECAVGVLSNYIRFVNADNVRKDRCSVSGKWLAFIDGISKIRLYVAKAVKSLEASLQHLKKQYAPTIAMLFHAYGETIDFFYDLVENGSCRLKGYQYDMIVSASRGLI